MTHRLLSLALLAACAPAPKADQAATVDSSAPVVEAAPAAPGGASVAAAFRCADSNRIFALFRNDSAGKAEVALAIGDERLHLPQVTSASGARYADSSITFWNKGDGAEFSRGGKQTTCQVEK